MPSKCLNTLWPSDTLWHHRIWSVMLRHIMACCLIAQRHPLNQCWLIISGVQWLSLQMLMSGILSILSQDNTISKWIYFQLAVGANSLNNLKVCTDSLSIMWLRIFMCYMQWFQIVMQYMMVFFAVYAGAFVIMLALTWCDLCIWKSRNYDNLIVQQLRKIYLVIFCCS